MNYPFEHDVYSLLHSHVFGHSVCLKAIVFTCIKCANIINMTRRNICVQFVCVGKKAHFTIWNSKNVFLITEFSVQLLESNKLLMFNYTAYINASVVH